MDWSRVLAGMHPRWDLHVHRWSRARPHQIYSLMADAEFRRTGRVDEAGILVRCWPGSVPVVVDGKHRLLAAGELGLPALWGRVWAPRGGIVWTGPLWLRKPSALRSGPIAARSGTHLSTAENRPTFEAQELCAYVRE